MKKVSWGVLSTAKIGWDRVLPAMQKSALCSIDAISSRSPDKAREIAARLGIPRAYGSYEELLADPLIEAVYNPLPNHLHVPWTLKALAAGKHVLCEKPIAVTAAEATTLIEAQRNSGRLLMEAFMVRTHPQWHAAVDVLRSGRIGELRAVEGHFSYTNLDPVNIRNRTDVAGGGLMDIGCYMILAMRWLFGAEPRRVVSLVERDPAMGTDRLASCLLDFPQGHGSFTCSTQLTPFQRVKAFGTRGRLEIEIPVNAAPDRPARIMIDDGRDLCAGGLEVRTFDLCNQYTLQGDAFSRAIREGGALPMSLEDSIANMRVIDALFRSEKSAAWEVV